MRAPRPCGNSPPLSLYVKQARLIFGGTSTGSAQYYVKAAAAAMTPVRSPYCGDSRSMARRRQPVVHRGSNPSALHRRFARPRVTGNQQDDPLAARDCPLESKVDCSISAVEIVAVEVERPVRADASRLQPPIPPAVERVALHRLVRCRRCTPRWSWRRSRCRLRCRTCSRNRGARGFNWFARQWPDGRRHPLPKLGLVSAERAHARPRPWATGSMPIRLPTCRRRSGPPRRQRPRRCRSGWLP